MSQTQYDKDLRSVQQARRLADRCRIAQREFAGATASAVDAICEAMAEAAYRDSSRLAQLAHEETGYGNPDDKVVKNQFAARGVWEWIRDIPTVGVVARDADKKMLTIAEPMGVVAALTPSTNPTSTAIYKTLIAVKGRNGIIVSPHPSAARCTSETIRTMVSAAERAGAPVGLIACLDEVAFAGTQEMMRHHAVNVILATGGGPMVRAAHSVGKPAYGVGPGNVPVWVDRSADVRKAARDIVMSKSFDCSLICATEQTVVADEAIAQQLRLCMEAEGAFWVSEEYAARLSDLLFNPDGSIKTRYVGKPARALAAAIDLSVPEVTRVLVSPLTGVGPDHPLSREKLTTVLGFISAPNAIQGLEYCVSILKFGGDGHSAVVHSQNAEQIESMAARLPAFRIIVNSMSTLGSVGRTCGFAPSFTLGCGGIGGAISSDNITASHLINLKRVGWELSSWLPQIDSDGHSTNDVKPEPDIEMIVREVLAKLSGGHEHSARSR